MAKLFSKKSKLPTVIVSGQLLVADFQTAMNNLVTAETAKFMANESERETMQSIDSNIPQNSVYVTPADLSPTTQADLLRTSVNAHLQKAQSHQINAYTAQQLANLQEMAEARYIGKKVRVTILNKKFNPVETYWQDSGTGQFRQGTIKSKSVKGVINEINFEKNVIVLSPDLKSRLILPQRKFIFVYVINNETLLPAVDLSLI